MVTISPDIELLPIELSIGCIKISLLGIYRPPKGNVNGFLQTLEAFIDSRSKNCMIVGDFNIDLLKVTNHCLKLTEALVSRGFKLCINNVTRPNHKNIDSGSLIDHIWSNVKMYVPYAAVIRYDLSDHFPVYLRFNVNKTRDRNKMQTITYRLHGDDNINKLKQKLAKIEWDDISQSDNINHAYENFEVKLFQLYDEACPLKNKALSENEDMPMDNV